MSICQFRTLATEIVVERLLKQAGEIMPKLASKVPKLHRSNMEQVRFESELNPMQKVVVNRIWCELSYVIFQC